MSTPADVRRTAAFRSMPREVRRSMRHLSQDDVDEFEKQVKTMSKDGKLKKGQFATGWSKTGHDPKTVEKILEFADKRYTEDEADFGQLVQLIKASHTAPTDAEVNEIMRLIDKNRDGVIDKKELKHSLESAGFVYTDEDIQDFMKLLDSNRDGKVDRVELAKFLADA